MKDERVTHEDKGKDFRMKTLDQMILDIRTALAANAPVDWGKLKQEITEHPDKDLLQYYLKGKGKNPHLEEGDRKVFRVGRAKIATRWIPAGRFLMGAGAGDREANDWEKPQHEVTITRGFWIAETPVTQGQYQAIMSNNPSYFKDAGLDAPVECVSWFDAAAFANKLSALEGLSACFVRTGEKMEGVGNKGSDYVGCKGWRLPTEAEWEYACRAGTMISRYWDLDKIAWYDKNSGDTTHAVGQKQGNAWGLHDTLGNVWEWVYDQYGGYSTQAATDLVGAATGTARVVRGGSWFNYGGDVRSANRNWDAPTDRNYNIGFRLVKIDT